MSNKISVLVADDHTIVRRGLVALISLSEDFVVVGEASDGREAVEMSLSLRPDVVLMDLNMPILGGMEATRQIKKRCPQIKVVILTGYDDDDLVRQMVSHGAHGYVLKTVTMTELHQAIRETHHGRPYFSQDIARKVGMNGWPEPVRTMGENTAGAQQTLTERERQILQLIAEGKSHQQISHLLHISVRTVDTHRNNILRKLNLHDTAGLVLYAVRNGIVIVPKKQF